MSADQHDLWVEEIRRALGLVPYTEREAGSSVVWEFTNASNRTYMTVKEWYHGLKGTTNPLRRDCRLELHSDRILELKRTLCLYCNEKWHQHVRAGGQCLFGATTYKETPDNT